MGAGATAVTVGFGGGGRGFGECGGGLGVVWGNVGGGLARVGAAVGGGGIASGSGRSISTAVGAGSAANVDNVGDGEGAGGGGSGVGGGEGATAGDIVAGGAGENPTFTIVMATITPAKPPTAQPSSTNTGTEKRLFERLDWAGRAFVGGALMVAVSPPCPGALMVIVWRGGGPE